MDYILKRKKLLVIAPHPDDEAFGCAGLISKVKNLGGKVYVVVVSLGDLKQYHRSRIIKGSVRRNEFINCMRYLKVDDYDILFQDEARHLRLDVLPRRDLIFLLEKEGRLSMDRIKPDIIALPPVSYNQDHESVFKAGYTACRPHLRDLKHFQRLVLIYDDPTLSWGYEREKFQPNFYVDISAYLKKKIKALSFYKSQLKHPFHQHSIENMTHLAKIRGREIAVDAAEAFVACRMVV